MSDVPRTGYSRDRLQPALLDRLIDEDPRSAVEISDARVITRARLRQSVLRDLTWLLNAIATFDSTTTAAQVGRAGASVLNFGMPALAGQYASRMDIVELERKLAAVIRAFEPRLRSDSLVVRALEHDEGVARNNVLTFEISAFLWAQPYPLELLLRTQVDIETGQVRVEDQTPDTASAKAAV